MYAYEFFVIALSFEYEVIKSNRKSVGIVISPDCKVIVRAPKRAKQSVIEKIIKEKTPWIKEKLAFFAPSLIKKLENKFSFLGKDLNLIFKDETAKREVILDGENIIVSGKNPKLQFEKWLFLRAAEVFLDRFEICFGEFSKHFSYKKPILKIRKMRSRWGSISSSGIMTLNLSLISAPMDCINYVIMHELCHLKHQNHGRSFHKLEASFIPNSKELDEKLKHFAIWLKF
jgi:predicted metal-dependent hydrolase